MNNRPVSYPQRGISAKPWRVLRRGDQFGTERAVVIDHDGHPVCQPRYHDDAPLIAAAPEMFDALTRAHRFLRQAGYDMTAINAALDKSIGVKP